MQRENINSESQHLMVEPKLNAMVEATRFIVESRQRTSSFMFELEQHPEVIGLVCFDRAQGTLTSQVEDGHSVLRFFLRYGTAGISYTNLSNPSFDEVSCLYQPTGLLLPTLDAAFSVIVQTARALHHITEFQNAAATAPRRAPPQSGIEVKRKFQVFSLPGKRVA